VRYLVRKDRHADGSMLRCEWAIRDDVEGVEERLQWRLLATGEPRLNGVRRNFEIRGEHRAFD